MRELADRILGGRPHSPTRIAEAVTASPVETENIEPVNVPDEGVISGPTVGRFAGSEITKSTALNAV
jgi:hypothetical protein